MANNIRLKDGNNVYLHPETNASVTLYDTTISGWGDGDVQNAIDLMTGGYYTTTDLSSLFVAGKCCRNSGAVGATAAMTITTDSNWTYINVPCVPGEQFIITAGAGSTYVAYTFLNASNKILATSGNGANLANVKITAPAGSVKLVCNSSIVVRPALELSRIVKQEAKWKYRKKVQLDLGLAVGNNTAIGGTATLSPAVNKDTAVFASKVISVTPGEKFVISGYAGNAYRICSIHNSAKKVLWVSDGIISAATAWEDKIITIPSGATTLVVNISFATTVNHDYIYKIVDVADYLDEQDILTVYGYERSYTDITHSLTLERKTISGNTTADSTVNALYSGLPNNGFVEVKTNAADGQFKVFKLTSGTMTQLTDDWTVYQHRYVGDYSSEYFVLLKNNAGTTLTLANASKQVKVYTLSDEGKGRKIRNLDKLKGKTIAFFGDSIVQGRYPNLGTSVNMVMDCPYSNIISGWSGQREPANYGIGGACVYNSDWRSLYLNCTNVTGYDIVFVCAGTNDWSTGVSTTNFQNALNYVVDTLKANNTSVILMTMPARQAVRDNTQNSQGQRLDAYAKIIRDTATSKGCQMIDLLGYTNHADFYATLADGLHPNEVGHGFIADKILSHL